MAARAMMPRREDVPGIAKDLPDFANFREALRVAPFLRAPGLCRSVACGQPKFWIR